MNHTAAWSSCSPQAAQGSSSGSSLLPCTCEENTVAQVSDVLYGTWSFLTTFGQAGPKKPSKHALKWGGIESKDFSVSWEKVQTRNDLQKSPSVKGNDCPEDIPGSTAAGLPPGRQGGRSWGPFHSHQGKMVPSDEPCGSPGLSLQTTSSPCSPRGDDRWRYQADLGWKGRLKGRCRVGNSSPQSSLLLPALHHTGSAQGAS